MMSQKEIEGFIEMLESFNRTEAHFAYSFIRNALTEVEFSVPKCSLDVGHKLIRGRVHQPGEEFYSNISDISYRRDLFRIKDFGRANEPCQSMFYCSDTPTTAFIETCTITREQSDKDFELITWGTWEVTKPIIITYVIGDTNVQMQNPTQRMASNKFQEFLEPFKPEVKIGLLLMHNYLSKQFKIKAEGHSSLYKISSAYTNWALNQYWADHKDASRKSQIIGGIMYASSLWPDQGMNIALKPEIVDSSLKLIDVRRDRYVRQGDFYDGTDTMDMKMVDHVKNIIEW
jgi:hypothetical protein